jgi:hypothetical protein
MLRSLLVAVSLTTLVAAAWSAPEPAVQRTVLEDDNVRIEELRVRGVNQRLVVRPKANAKGQAMPEYEILPAEPGRDSAQDRRAAGQRVWRLFSF